VVATQNPVEMEGTYPLPEAQLDRFLFQLRRRSLSTRRSSGAWRSHPHVQDYAVRLVLATQPSALVAPGEASFAPPMVNQYVRLGASPRAAQAIVLAGKCRVLLDGRSAVSTDDVRAAALPALRHRIILNFEASAEGVTTDAVVLNILATLPLSVG
jgi:MoxR-like ATPase